MSLVFFSIFFLNINFVQLKLINLLNKFLPNLKKKKRKIKFKSKESNSKAVWLECQKFTNKFKQMNFQKKKNSNNDSVFFFLKNLISNRQLKFIKIFHERRMIYSQFFVFFLQNFGDVKSELSTITNADKRTHFHYK